MADRSAWDSQFGSGLKEAYDFTVHMASFGTDLTYNNGQTYLCILVGEDENGEDATEMLSVGADWESVDGQHLTHAKKTGTINRNSNYGRWCQDAAAACETSSSDWIFDKDSKDASIWIGTKWRLKEKKVGEAYKNKRTGEDVAARFRLQPDEFLGFVSDEAPVVTSPAPESVAATKRAALLAKASAATPAPSPAIPASNGSGILGELATLAKTNSFEDFLNAALKFEDVLSDDVLTESLIDSGPNGFYAKNK